MLTHKCTPLADLKQNKNPKCAYRAVSHLEVGEIGGVGKPLLGDLLQAAVLRLLFQASLKPTHCMKHNSAQQQQGIIYTSHFTHVVRYLYRLHQIFLSKV